jgi:hypothetical protein
MQRLTTHVTLGLRTLTSLHVTCWQASIASAQLAHCLMPRLSSSRAKLAYVSISIATCDICLIRNHWKSVKGGSGMKGGSGVKGESGVKQQLSGSDIGASCSRGGDTRSSLQISRLVFEMHVPAQAIRDEYPQEGGKRDLRPHLRQGGCGGNSSAPTQHHQRIAFDAGLCSACEERVPRLLKQLHVAARVLSCGGMIAVSEPNGSPRAYALIFPAGSHHV